MTTRIHENLWKGIFFMILFITLLLQTMLGYAQSADTYRGFVASFGTRTANISSDIAKLNGSGLVQTGGQLGLVYGNKIVKSRIGLLGYYTSGGSSAGTTDLFASNISVNFYPLSLLSNRTFVLEPYLTAGLDYDQYKFYGFYLQQEPGQMNYSQAEAPFLGKIKQVNTTGGVGIQVKLKDQFDFIHVFSEFRMGHNLSANTKHVAFAETQTKNPRQLIVGISFGAHR
ncbi:MAG: hypothetical protein WA874_03595 [Chryseosolibacter sp.]